MAVLRPYSIKEYAEMVFVLELVQFCHLFHAFKPHLLAFVSKVFQFCHNCIWYDNPAFQPLKNQLGKGFVDNSRCVKHITPLFIVYLRVKPPSCFSLYSLAYCLLWLFHFMFLFFYFMFLF